MLNFFSPSYLKTAKCYNTGERRASLESTTTKLKKKHQKSQKIQGIKLRKIIASHF